MSKKPVGLKIFDFSYRTISKVNLQVEQQTILQKGSFSVKAILKWSSPSRYIIFCIFYSREFTFCYCCYVVTVVVTVVIAVVSKEG